MWPPAKPRVQERQNGSGSMDFVHQRKHVPSRVLQCTQGVCRVLGEGRHLPRLTAAPPSPARRQLELTWQPASKRASQRARLLVLTDAVCRAFIYRSKRRADKCPECARRLCHQDVFLKKCFWHLTSLASLFAVSSARPHTRPARGDRL